MDSLQANYASSDDDEPQLPKPLPSSKPAASFFSSLPPPKSSSSLPKPKQPVINPTPISDSANQPMEQPPKSSSIFSSLPPPKSHIPQQPISNTKRVVQFRVPIIPPSRNSVGSDDEDEEFERKERRRREESETVRQAPSVTSFLSSIPAPRNSSTLGVHSTSGSGRRSIVETETLAVSSTDGFEVGNESGMDQNLGNNDAYANYESGLDQNTGQSVNYGGSYEYYESGVDQSNGGNTTNYGNYDSYAGYEHYENNWDDRSVTTPSVTDENALRVLGKRGRNGIPTEIVEVKQDELIKNRPREDQVKLTGIAFGPSYQPVSTSKGKPSKLHKRKHQIGTLYFDMKQKETELAERRAKGFLTKAETQAKYGW